MEKEASFHGLSVSELYQMRVHGKREEAPTFQAEKSGFGTPGLDGYAGIW
jgi:hypothetical protein